MRLREPFQGVKLASGHLIVHVGLLFGNYFILDSETVKILQDETIPNFLNPNTNISLYSLFELSMRTHIVCIISQLL